MSSHGEHREVIEVDHPHSFDPQEVNAKAVVLFGIATLVTLVVTIFALQFYFDTYKEKQVYEQVLAPVSEDLKALRAREDVELHSYRFIDRDKGLVRLPIERAMELLLSEAAAGRFFYPTQPAPIKKPDPAVDSQTPTANPQSGPAAPPVR